MYSVTTGVTRVLGRRLLPRQSVCALVASNSYPHCTGTIRTSSTGGTSTSTSNPSEDPSQPVPVLSSSRTTTATGTGTPQSEEWIPPNRPLSGDQGYTGVAHQSDDSTTGSTSPNHSPSAAAIDDALLFVIDDNDTEEDIQRKLEAALKLEEELELQEFQKALQREEQQEEEERQQQRSITNTNQAAPDWLATRRAALGKRSEDAARVVPIRHYQLLTEQELVALLEYHEGIHVQVIRDNPQVPRMGGADGMIVCEASTLFHVQAITRALIDHLKERKLQERGILGAQMGSNRNLHSSNWNVVDCHIYIVHVLDGPTRQALQLEKLWSGKDPLWKLDVANEDAVDRYVEQHPVPPTYGPQQAPSWDIGRLERSTHTHCICALACAFACAIQVHHYNCR